MGFHYSWIGRPTTALALMNVIRDKLIEVGWSLKWEGTDGSGNNIKYLQCAPYIMPDGSDAGSAVLELRNPNGTNHVDVRMWTSWDSQNNVPVPPNCPDDNNGSYLRLSYGYQASLHYWLYANEYWFALLQSDSSGSPPYADSQHKTVVGLVLPPNGIPTAPPYKALFVASPYNTAGSMIDGGNGTRFLIYSNPSNTYICLNPSNATPSWGNWQSLTNERVTPTRYVGHPDQPMYLYPLTVQTFGEFKYGMITGNLTMPLGSTQNIGNETWVNIIAGYGGGHGQIWVRTA